MNKNIFKLLIVLSFAFNLNLFGQKETSNWVLYDGQMVDFKTNPPTVTMQNSTIAGLYHYNYDGENSTISDSSGQLLLYNLGSYVFDKNNKVIYQAPDTIYQYNSFRGIKIIQDPSDLNGFYFIFGVTNTILNGSILKWNYYKRDNQNNFNLTKNGNIKFMNRYFYAYNSPLSIGSDSCNAIWMICNASNKSSDTTSYYTFKIDKSGIDTIPTIYTDNKSLGYNAFSPEASPDGKSIAINDYAGYNGVSISRFNNINGQIISFKRLLTNNIMSSFSNYSLQLSFDSTGSKIYFITQTNGPSKGGLSLMQLDTNGTYKTYEPNIIGSCGPTGIGIAYNKKVYLHYQQYDYTLSRCEYLPSIKDFTLNDEVNFEKNVKINNIYSWFLPRSTVNYYGKRKKKAAIWSSNYCSSDSTKFSVLNACVDVPFTWNFGDNYNLSTNTATGYESKHKYSQNGTYMVRLVTHKSNGNDTTFQEVYIGNPAKPNLGSDTELVCKQTLVIGTPNVFNTIYSWADSINGNNRSITTTGTYILKASNSCGILTDTIKVNFKNPTLALNDSIVPCYNSVTLDGGQIFDTYLWSMGEKTRFVSITSPGLYWVKSANTCGSVIDSLKITWKAPIPPKVNYRPDFIGISDSCISYPILFFLKDTIGVQKVDWDFGDGSKATTFKSSHKYDITNSFIVTTKAAHLCFIDSSRRIITLDALPFVNLGVDTLVNCGQPIVLTAGEGFKKYQWQDGSGFSTLTAVSSSFYSVRVYNSCGSASDTIEIRNRNVIIPNVFTPNSDGKNDELILGNYLPKTGKLTIMNRWGTEVFKSEDYQNDWKAKNIFSDGLYFYRFESGCEKIEGYLQVLR